jgi:uncharacterized cupredoxin-like copper-binding protein
MVMAPNQASVAEIALPDRTVPILVDSQFCFSPDAIDVTVGETVAFVVTNNTAIPYEFLIGDEAVQTEHDRELAASTESMTDMDAKPFAIDIPAFSTVTLVYTFDETGDLIMGCHVPGHYAACMRGAISVRTAEARSEANQALVNLQ